GTQVLHFFTNVLMVMSLITASLDSPTSPTVKWFISKQTDRVTVEQQSRNRFWVLQFTYF
ncbi:MAG TPA: hypothetical protein PK940_02330, partial [Rectinema sp.]|nr:hypothetical protein [Rectinema sp.]HPD69047.1 hypothetical protein [Rectinema sp.]